MPNTTVFRIQDDMNFDLVVSLGDRAGNVLSAPPAGVIPDWAASDPSIVTVTPSATDPFTANVTTLGKLGTAQVSVSMVIDGTTLTGILDLEVVTGSAATLQLSPINLQPRTIS